MSTLDLNESGTEEHKTMSWGVAQSIANELKSCISIIKEEQKTNGCYHQKSIGETYSLLVKDIQLIGKAKELASMIFKNIDRCHPLPVIRK